MRIICLFILSGLILPWPAGGQSHRTVTDPVGRTLRVPVDPQRVVALAPSVTEIIYALGQERRLAGVTQYSDYPPQAQQLPKVGSYIYLDVERIAALRPDLCVGIKDGNPLAAVERIESFGIPVFAVNPVDLDSVMKSVLAMGELLAAADQAGALVYDMSRRIERVAARTRHLDHRPRVFFQIGVSPIVSVGSNTFIAELIDRAGGQNVAAGPSPYPRFGIEQIIALAPEVMIISSMDRSAVFEQVRDGWKQWTSIPAVRDNRIFIAPSNIFDRPTPRLVDGLELLARMIHPDLFGDPP